MGLPILYTSSLVLLRSSGVSYSSSAYWISIYDMEAVYRGIFGKRAERDEFDRVQKGFIFVYN